MKKVELIFPDTSSIADFILENRIAGALVNSTEHRLSALLMEGQIEKAIFRHGAIRQEPVIQRKFSDD